MRLQTLLYLLPVVLFSPVITAQALQNDPEINKMVGEIKATSLENTVVKLVFVKSNAALLYCMVMIENNYMYLVLLSSRFEMKN